MLETILTHVAEASDGCSCERCGWPGMCRRRRPATMVRQKALAEASRTSAFVACALVKWATLVSGWAFMIGVGWRARRIPLARLPAAELVAASRQRHLLTPTISY